MDQYNFSASSIGNSPLQNCTSTTYLLWCNEQVFWFLVNYHYAL